MWMFESCFPPSENLPAKPRVVIVPGMGIEAVYEKYWYAFMKTRLEESGRFSEVVLRDMPDAFEAKESVWLPFIRSSLKVDENTVFIGHSSGAVAGMRLLEDSKLLGAVLISACHTDLDYDFEKLTGYFDRPWKWNQIRRNAHWIHVYHSEDDPYIPRAEADHIAENLHASIYKCYKDRSHFFLTKDVEEVISDIFKILDQ